MFVHLADQADAFSLSEGQFYLQVSLEGILGYCIAILQHLVCGRLDGLGNLIGRQNLHIISWEDAQPAMVFPLQPVLVHFLMDIDNVTLLQRQLLGGLCLEVKLEPGGLPLGEEREQSGVPQTDRDLPRHSLTLGTLLPSSLLSSKGCYPFQRR